MSDQESAGRSVSTAQASRSIEYAARQHASPPIPSIDRQSPVVIDLTKEPEENGGHAALPEALARLCLPSNAQHARWHATPRHAIAQVHGSGSPQKVPLKHGPSPAPLVVRAPGLSPAGGVSSASPPRQHPAALTPGVRPWVARSVRDSGLGKGILSVLASNLAASLQIPPSQGTLPWETNASKRASMPVIPVLEKQPYRASLHPSTPPRERSSDSQPVALLSPPSPPSRHRRAHSADSALTAALGSSANEAALRLPIMLDSFGRQQCAGIKRDGTRCTRFVTASTSDRQTQSRSTTPSPSPAKKRITKAAPGSASTSLAPGSGLALGRPGPGQSPSSENEDDLGIAPDYCFQHVAEINKTTGFILPNGKHISFSMYIPSTLSARAQARLRTALSTPPTPTDLKEQGYCYVYELRDRARSGREGRSNGSGATACFKVGRSINVFKRLDEWRSRCQSADPILRSFLPAQQGQMLLAGASTASVPGVRLSRRWERLCHLELEDVGERVNEECKDCKSKHREMFMVELQKGGYEAVLQIVRRWMHFVQIVADAY